MLIDSPRLLLSDKVSEPESSKIPLLLQNEITKVNFQAIFIHEWTAQAE